MNDPSVRVLLRQLAEDAKAYARAEMDYAKAEVRDRSAHIGPAVALYAGAAVLGLSLIVAIIVAVTIWAGIYLGFVWALIGVVAILGLVIWLLARAAARHVKKVMRPWQKP
ncbi:MAG: phage holin family protein [Chakrabartia sp.]